MRLGLACTWEVERATTWSNIPWNLYSALSRLGDVVDVGVMVRRLPRVGLRVLSARRAAGRWTSVWRWSPAWQKVGGRLVQRHSRLAGCDAVLQTENLYRGPAPFFVWQDLSFDALRVERAEHPADVLGFPALKRDVLVRHSERQRRFFADATRIFAMSRWLADSLVTHSGVTPAQVRVVHAGRNAPLVERSPNGKGEGRRLLFIGRDFHRKGGDLVVDALELLRSQYDPALTLTVAGPASWPGSSPPPSGVNFVGAVSLTEVADLQANHDLFVMPSRFEAFGIAFLEALASGTPCIGRDAYAMPEIIEPGVNGALIGREDGAAEVAEAVVNVLEDDPLRQRCIDNRDEVARATSWDRAAEAVLQDVRASLSC